MKAIVEFINGTLIVVDQKITGSDNIVDLFNRFKEVYRHEGYVPHQMAWDIKAFAEKFQGKIKKLDYKIESKPGVIY